MAAQTATLVARSIIVAANCTTSTCPASESAYGYAPSLAATWIFFAAFIGLALVFFFQSFQYPTWRYYALALCFGCCLEAIGYIARLVLHYNPFSDSGVNMSIAFLTMAPALFSAAMYVLLAELIKTFSRSLALLKPDRHSYIFIACDCLSLMLQAAGAGTAVNASTEQVLRQGNKVMLVGAVFQLVTMIGFGLLGAHYVYRLATRHNDIDRNGIRFVPIASMALWGQSLFKRFIACHTVASALLLVRCCYRLAELRGGWGSQVMRSQGLFIAFDSLAIAGAAALLAAYHPGRCMQLLGDNQNLLHDPDPAKQYSSTSSLRSVSPSPSVSSRSNPAASPASAFAASGRPTTASPLRSTSSEKTNSPSARYPQISRPTAALDKEFGVAPAVGPGTGRPRSVHLPFSRRALYTPSQHTVVPAKPAAVIALARAESQSQISIPAPSQAPATVGPLTSQFGPPSTQSTTQKLKAWFSPWSTPGAPTAQTCTPGAPTSTSTSSSRTLLRRPSTSSSIKSNSTWNSVSTGKVSPLDEEEAGGGRSPSYPFPRMTTKFNKTTNSTATGPRTDVAVAVRVTGSNSPTGSISPIVRHQHSLPKVQGYHVLTAPSVPAASVASIIAPTPSSSASIASAPPSRAAPVPVVRAQSEARPQTQAQAHPLASRYTPSPPATNAGSLMGIASSGQNFSRPNLI